MNVEEIGYWKKKEFVQATVGFIQRVEPSTANSLGTVRSAYNFNQFLSYLWEIKANLTGTTRL